MFRVCRVILGFALFVFANAAIAATSSVLFVGNSLTYMNDLPAVFKKFAAASPLHMDIEVTSLTPGGAFLYDQWKHGQAVALLREKHPNFLVLQGQSTEPLSAPQSFAQSAARLKAEADRVGARTILFATWARPANDPFYKEPASGGSPSAMHARLDLAYATVARNTGATLAPVGVAFVRAQQIAPEIRLLDGTQHPSPVGTYLAAAVLFRAMFGVSPVQSEYHDGLPKELAIGLQHVAGEVSMSSTH
jgi:hypothetical protein